MQMNRSESVDFPTGKSSKDTTFVKTSSKLTEPSVDDSDMKNLIDFLRPRIESARRGNILETDIEEIIADTIKRNQV